MADSKVELLVTVAQTEGCMQVRVHGKDKRAVEATAPQLLAAAEGIVGAIRSKRIGCGCEACANIDEGLEMVSAGIKALMGAMLDARVTDEEFTDLTRTGAMN